MDPTFAIANALPTDSKLASKTDVQANTAAVEKQTAVLETIATAATQTQQSNTELVALTEAANVTLPGLFDQWSTEMQQQYLQLLNAMVAQRR